MYIYTYVYTLPTLQALEAMTRAQLVLTYDALQPAHPQQLPPRTTHGRGNYTVNLKTALMALFAGGATSEQSHESCL